jgi:surface protein
MFYSATSFNQDLSHWCVTNIPSEPFAFANSAYAWVLPQPIWGTCPIEFISIWQTTSPSESITLPLEFDGTYNFYVNWGDGNTDTITAWNQSGVTHVYTSANTYTVTISGTIEGFNFQTIDFSKTNITEILQWGNLKLGNNGGYFSNCTNLILTGVTDSLILQNTTNLTQLFAGCSSITTINNINYWDVSNVNDMNSLFFLSYFDDDISGWDVSNVIDMTAMFNSTPFNYDISSWITSACTTMSTTFAYNNQFNQNINSWNVSNVTDMGGMFFNAAAFNQPLSGWNVSNVTNMSTMFYGAAFNQDLSVWNVSNVTNMNGMFQATPFNSDINNWDVSNVTNMNNMFNSATSFNQPLSGWNVSNVTDMGRMFENANSFNQNLINWCVTQISSKPSNFDLNASAWVLPQPIWGNCPENSFISVWRTTTLNESITLPYYSGGTYTGTIDWGDGNVSANTYTNRTHTYSSAGSYTVTIPGKIVGFNFGQVPTTRSKIIEILRWGTLKLGFNYGEYFKGCGNLNLSGVTDTLNLDGIYGLSEMFVNCSSLTTINNLNSWNVSGVTYMNNMFSGAILFDQNIGNWNTSNVVTMGGMFGTATSFNNGGSPSISGWNVSNVSAVGGMQGMFGFATSFNQDLSNWCVTNITSEPAYFALGASSWVLPKPVWGTCP